VRWTGKSDLTDHGRQTCEDKIDVTNAQLYSFWCE
jgi:hypothetical protein